MSASAHAYRCVLLFGRISKTLDKGCNNINGYWVWCSNISVIKLQHAQTAPRFF